MAHIKAHGYVGLTAPDVEAWRPFATSVLGMTVADGPDDDQLLLRMDERGWRISVQPGTGGLAFCGWEVADEEALAELAAHLEENGVPTKTDSLLAEKRNVAGLITCEDPGGFAVEFFHGAFVPREPFHSPTGAEFVTSKAGYGDLGFGHAVLMYDDEAAAKHFYLDLLGFKVSDTITIGPATGIFTHVNGRHHSLAFAGLPHMTPQLNHIMVEVTDLDMLGRALDVVMAGGAELLQTLGKHTNDHMISFYVATPSGFMLEYGYAGRMVDDTTWTTSSYRSASYWGHLGGPTPEEMQRTGQYDI